MRLIFFIIGIGIALSTIYIIKAPTIWEMLLGYTSLTVKLIAIMVLLSISIGSEWAIDAVIAYMMLSIGGLIILAYFNSRRTS